MTPLPRLIADLESLTPWCRRVMIGIQESDPALFESVHIFNTFFYKKISAKKPSGNE